MKWIKNYIWLLLLVSVISCGKKQGSESELRSKISRLPMIYTIEATAEVIVENTDDNASVLSFLGNRNIIIPVRANIKAGINLPQVDDVTIEGDKVYFTLPDPIIEIGSTKILYDQIVDDVTGLRDKFTSREEAEISRVGRNKIKATLSKFDLIAPAQERAEIFLMGVANKLGYTACFKARPSYNEKDLVKFVKE
ncbi:MAG: DUF4230 domain-containing protein [Prevotella sp.]|nr:DUF4230 domain-containing protein [Prevotella sp.]